MAAPDEVFVGYLLGAFAGSAEGEGGGGREVEDYCFEEFVGEGAEGGVVHD